MNNSPQNTHNETNNSESDSFKSFTSATIDLIKMQKFLNN